MPERTLIVGTRGSELAIARFAAGSLDGPAVEAEAWIGSGPIRIRP